MTNEKIVFDFLEYAQKNSELKEKILTLSDEAREKDSTEVNAIIKEKLIPLAKENGFEFTFEDYKQAISQKNNQKKELDLDELENVSGGSILDVVIGNWIYDKWFK